MNMYSYVKNKKAGAFMEEVTMKVYNIKNLDCAHCASKIEAAINEMEEVEEAVMIYTAKKFRIKARHTTELFEKIMKKCDDIEPGVQLVEEGHDTDHSSDLHEKCHEHNHEHCHGHSHSETHEHSHSNEHSGNEIPFIVTGAVLLVGAKIAGEFTGVSFIPLIIYIVSYLILGGRVLADAVKGILRGRVFSEKFLMALATLAAFALKDYPEAVGVMLFYRVGEYFEEKAVENSRKSVLSAADMRPETVILVNEEGTETIPAEKAEPGQIILVRAGDRIPLDGIVCEGKTSIDTSSVTGEHLPVDISENDNVLSGCVNLSSPVKIQITKPLSESMVSKIIDSIENASASKPKLDRFITRFANIYTPVVVIVALLTAVIPSLITHDWHKWIYTAVTFLVISCPCAVVLSVPLTYFAGIGAGSKNGILFTNGTSIEAADKIKAVVMDKTGTVTNGGFNVNKTEIYEDTEETEIIRLCASCESQSTHPVAQCIVKKSESLGIDLAEPENITETAGMGLKAIINSKTVLCGNSKLMNKYNINIDKYTPGVSGTDILCAVDGVLAGCFRISDTIKTDAVQTIRKIKSRGIKTVMLTGDSEGSASETARLTGIDKYYAKLLPEDKLRIMKDIRKEHGMVMFVGDGINDAPVLAGADVSAAMGSGADAAVEAADIVIMNSDMKSVSTVLDISSDTNRIAKQNIIFALAFKLAVMVLGFAGFANMWFAVFADSGVAALCVLNSIRILRKKY